MNAQATKVTTMKITRLAALILGVAVFAAGPVLAQTFGADQRIYPTSQSI